jgi:hypothetical protein
MNSTGTGNVKENPVPPSTGFGRFIETAWVILNCAGGWLGYSTLSMTADVSTAPKPDQ